MKIKSAEFIKGIIGTDDIMNDGIPQVAFVGRSNVGKSSVINSLVNRKNLVKSSATPGKTQQINFFLVNDNIYFVDLPGYGFAKLSEKKREKLRKLILWYLSDSGVKPYKVVLIIDAKVGPTDFDMEMLGFLAEHGHNVIILANKADKLNMSERAKQSKLIQEKLRSKDIFFYSAKTKDGVKDVFREIFK